MAKPDPRQAGLDPGHILAICNRVAGDGGHEPVGFLLAAPDGVRIGVKSRRAARQMRAELTHIGYRTVLIRPRRRWRLHVTGWSGQALERRLAAMRATIAQLRGTRAATAAIVIGQYRNLVRSVPADQASSAALAAAERQIRTTVVGACGVFAPHDPVALPADRGDALRLRTIRALEQVISEMIEEHLRTAGRALAHYVSLCRHGTADWANHTALRRAASTPFPDGSGLGGEGFAPAPSGLPPPPLGINQDAAGPTERGRTKRTPSQHAQLDFQNRRATPSA